VAATDNIEMVRRRFEELDNGNFDVLDELFSPRYQLHPGGGAEPLSLEETKDLYRRLYDAFPDLKHNLDQQLADGDRVVTRWTARGTHKAEFLGVEPTGEEVNLSGINVYEIEDGRFVRSDVSWDLLPALQRLRVVSHRASLFDSVRGRG
jgi:steroid delta-isomerase-like uncharacterized protein